MKNIIKFMMLMSTIVVCTMPVLGKNTTIITAPLDSRPISNEYLKNLVNLGEDEFIMPDKSNLDIFTTGNIKLNRFAKSDEVRKEVERNVKNNNNTNTTVIINTSSYITGGVVGSAVYDNYNKSEIAIEELSKLVTTYKDPYYYVNSVMPRTLPEDRNNIIWPNTNKVDGLGSFYCKYNDDKDIKKSFSKVTPSQLLMEWSYVQNKKNEGYNLTKWENDFLYYFNTTYLNNKKYSNYINKYKDIYEKSSIISKSLIDLTLDDKVDELILSVNDFQLPTFIANIEKIYPNNTWIQKENGHPIKFSWARWYFSTSLDSVQNYHKKTIGNLEFIKSLNGESNKINYIFGLDEIPQMIYARDLSRRNNLSTNFNINFEYNLDSEAAKNHIGVYDSISAIEIFNNVINFINNVSINTEKVKTNFNVYVNQYLDNKKNTNENIENKLLKDMFNAYNNGINIGLIENYSFDTINNGTNSLFKKLINDDYLNSIGLNNNSVSQLGFYSSWNTNANAIGLGISHGQVFSIIQQNSKNYENVAFNHAKILAQHLLEDGVYAGNLKHNFSTYNYNLSNNNSIKNEVILKNQFINSKIIDTIVKNDIKINGEIIDINNGKIINAGFPWLRKFDCFVEINFN